MHGPSSSRRSVIRSLGLTVALVASGSGFIVAAPVEDPAACDEAPTGTETTDYWLHFRMPSGDARLLFDSRYDGRPAKIEVHRVRPVYAHGRCPSVPARAAVLIHGRTIPAPPTFDLRHGPLRTGELSLQEALALAGIDTFAPSLLGYGRSTRFGLNDPCNASLPAFGAGGCAPEFPGCDRTNNPTIFSLDQQRRELATNPLAGQLCAHSSPFPFGGTDLWVRDIRQVVTDAIERAQLGPGGRVTLVGYSFGAQRVGRALDPAKNPDIVAKVDRAVYMAPLFYQPFGAETPAEQSPPFATFPLVLNTAGGTASWTMPAGRHQACTGHIVEGSPEDQRAQALELEEEGSQWGGTDPTRPTGLLRSPTFSGYGFNSAVAARMTTPALVIQGLDDAGLPPPAGGHSCALYKKLAPVEKVLVQIECASHGLQHEGCSEDRCRGGLTYDGTYPWAGPRTTVAAALVEWITSGTFTVPGGPPRGNGSFAVDASGVASETLPRLCPP